MNFIEHLSPSISVLSCKRNNSVSFHTALCSGQNNDFFVLIDIPSLDIGNSILFRPKTAAIYELFISFIAACLKTDDSILFQVSKALLSLML